MTLNTMDLLTTASVGLLPASPDLWSYICMLYIYTCTCLHTPRTQCTFYLFALECLKHMSDIPCTKPMWYCLCIFFSKLFPFQLFISSCSSLKSWVIAKCFSFSPTLDLFCQQILRAGSSAKIRAWSNQCSPPPHPLPDPGHLDPSLIVLPTSLMAFLLPHHTL